MQYFTSIELWLSIASLFFIGIGGFYHITKKQLAFLANTTILIIFILFQSCFDSIQDDFIFLTAKMFSVFFVFSTCLANLFFASSSEANIWEYIPLNILNLLGSFIVMRSNDFLVLFLGLEIQALICYVLVSLAHQKSPLSTEAGLKYFSLGATNTCVMLFGISLIYGFTGNINHFIISSIELNTAARLGFCLFILGLLFKLAAAPLHAWMLDVYQESSIFALSTFISINKLTSLLALIITLRVTSHSLELANIVDIILQLSIILSLLVGCLGAMSQDNFKRFIAYNSVFNIAYVLMSLKLGNYSLAVSYGLAYAISLLFVLNIFASANIDIDRLKISQLWQLRIISRSKTVIFSITLLSFIGIPPLVGFSAKYYVLYSLFIESNYALLAIALLTNLIVCYYYLRIIKNLFSDHHERHIEYNLAHRPKVHEIINVCGIGFILLGWLFIDYMVPVFIKVA